MPTASLLLTDNGRLQQRLTDPTLDTGADTAQVEGTQTSTTEESSGGLLQGRRTRPARVRWLQGVDEPDLPERIHQLAKDNRSPPTAELALQKDGTDKCADDRRRGLPTLRLVRCSIDLMDGEAPPDPQGLSAGDWRWLHQTNSSD